MPNNDYILRSDAMRCKCTFEQSNGVEIEPIEAVPFAYLRNIPAADVEPVVHGKWEYDSDHIPHCSECGTIALQRHKLYLEEKIYDVPFVLSKRCPECGAKMGKEEEDGVL